MKNTFYILGFWLLCPLLYAQNVGVGTVIPAAKMDINGDIALRTSVLTLANAGNHNVATPSGKFSSYRITGPSAAFSVTGITGGQNGRVVILENATNQTLTIAHLNPASLPQNQIITGYNSDIKVSPFGSVIMQYNLVDNKWVVNSLNSSQQGYWNLSGNTGTSMSTNFIGTTDNVGLAFKTNNIQHMQITPQGRFGINSITPMGFYYPYARIEIQDSTGLNSDIVIRTAAASGFNGVPAWVSMKSQGTLQNPTLVLNQDYLAEHYYMGYDGTGFKIGAILDVNIDGAPGVNDLPTRFSFFTVADGSAFPQERMRIRNNGDIWFANLYASLNADQYGSLELGGRDNMMGFGMPYIDFHFNNRLENYNARIVNNQHQQLEVFFAEGNGNFKVNGTVTASCGTLICSDARFKSALHPITSVIASLSGVNAYYYQWKKEEFPQQGFNSNRQVGVLAQEVEAVFPELVVTGADGYKAVDYARLTPLLLQAIKEQQAQIEAQEKRIRALEEKVGE